MSINKDTLDSFEQILKERMCDINIENIYLTSKNAIEYFSNLEINNKVISEKIFQSTENIKPVENKSFDITYPVVEPVFIGLEGFTDFLIKIGDGFARLVGLIPNTDMSKYSTELKLKINELGKDINKLPINGTVKYVKKTSKSIKLYESYLNILKSGKLVASHYYGAVEDRLNNYIKLLETYITYTKTKTGTFDNTYVGNLQDWLNEDQNIINEETKLQKEFIVFKGKTFEDYENQTVFNVNDIPIIIRNLQDYEKSIQKYKKMLDTKSKKIKDLETEIKSIKNPLPINKKVLTLYAKMTNNFVTISQLFVSNESEIIKTYLTLAKSIVPLKK